MKKKFFKWIGGALVVIALIAGIKAMQVRKAIAAAAANVPPPESVTTTVLKEESWPQSIHAVGTVQPIQGVVLGADLAGVVKKVNFESGTRVKAGDVLMELDTQQEEAQLHSAEAKREMMSLSLKRAQELLRTQNNSQAQLDQALADYRTADAAVAEINALINRKTIRAPFDGEAGIRQVNVGQYLVSGAPIVSLQSLDKVYVNFSVPQHNLGKLKVGTPVEVTSDALGDIVFKGTLTAVNSMVDEATRNVLVQATVDNPNAQLRPGIFVNAEVVLPETDKIIAAPASSIAFAPYGDSVFVVEDITKDGKTYKGVRQQFVKLGATRGDLVAILSGVKPGEEIVTSGVFKLRPNVAVSVNNAIQPEAKLNPKPADT